MNGLHFGIVMLVPILLVAISVGTAIILLMARRGGPRVAHSRKSDGSGAWPVVRVGFVPQPERWLAIKHRKPSKVQTALGLQHAQACSWLEGLLGQKPFFIAPSLEGWTVVVGSALPDPAVDVDGCFRFLLGLSRKLGQVHFFYANRVVHHHAWVWVKRGRVVRAYVWAGTTLWTQGLPTPAEKELDLKCFDYAEAADDASFDGSKLVAMNVDKVPLLAARWGLDPAHLGEMCLGQAQGIAGERAKACN